MMKRSRLLGNLIRINIKDHLKQWMLKSCTAKLQGSVDEQALERLSEGQLKALVTNGISKNEKYAAQQLLLKRAMKEREIKKAHTQKCKPQ
ncbi:hypothetical protein [Photobacterium indicum]|jgi:hypothetical protein|uniref:Uncharacterized protein n=1 Tax=Photobacterium indicum TaxID=81447 RepID=A0A2T3L1V5_9GAMM|nr:hypothetical protein [Photobacterium indicum]PSV42580.1 hypothetical protein C9J47_25065 [Photobacterium indicum]